MIDAKYEILLYWSDDDMAFVAEVPELPGCLAHGKTNEDALKNIQEAMELWIDTSTETGMEVPQPKGRRLMCA